MHETDPRDDQIIDLGIASSQTQGVGSLIMEALGTLLNPDGISTD